jgi:hypothetical protein
VGIYRNEKYVRNIVEMYKKHKRNIRGIYEKYLEK